MEDNFDLKGFLNDPKVQANKPAAIQYLRSKGIVDAMGNVVNKTQDKSLTGSGVGSVPVLKQATEFGAGIGSAIGRAGLNVGKSFLNLAQGVSNVGSKVL